MQKIPIRYITTIQKEPDFSSSFNIRDIRDLLAAKDMVQELHRHDFYYLLALKNGKGNHEIDFTPYKVGDHTVFFMRPGQVHQLTLKTGSTGYMMNFRTDFYHPHDKSSNEFLRRAGNLNFYKSSTIQFQKLHSILTDIFLEFTVKQEGYQQAIKAKMDILFIELVRQLSKSHPVNANTHVQEQLRKLLQLLDQNITLHKQVSEYADMLHLSIYQLNTITKSTLGKTCSELINEQVILESKRYLLATSNQVKEIAWHLGFEDISYFIRFFKKHTGYSPEAFRLHFR